MNIFNTQHLQTKTKGGILGDSSVMGGLENQVNLDPEALKLLEQSSLESGVDFDQVLKATKQGQDPEAVIELLKNNNEAPNLEDKKLALENFGQKATNKEVVGPQLNNQKSISQNQELQQLLGQGTEAKNSESLNQAETLAQGLPKERSAFFPNQAKQNVNSKMLNQMSPEQAALKINQQNITSQVQGEQIAQNANVAQPLQQAVKNNPYQAQSSQFMVGNKQVLEQGTKKNNLLSLNNFMDKQSPSLKKNAAKKAYQPISDSMFNQKVDASLPGAIKAPQKETTIQDVLLGQMDSANEISGKLVEAQPKQSIMAKGETVDNAAKVFDINSLSKLDTTSDVISKIQDYIIQSKVSSQSQVEMSFDHKELGKVDLMVQKGAGDQLNISIGTNSVEAAKFFNRNQADLLGSLAQSGIQVGDFKLETSQGNNNQSQSQDSSKQQFAQGQKGQHQSEFGQREQDSKKREELWEQFGDKEVA